MDNAFKYIEKNGGLCTEADYPYVSGETTHQHFLCLQKNCKVVADSTPRNYSDVQVDSEAALMSAVSLQPVSIAIEADQKDFQLYKSGDSLCLICTNFLSPSLTHTRHTTCTTYTTYTTHDTPRIPHDTPHVPHTHITPLTPLTPLTPHTQLTPRRKNFIHCINQVCTQRNVVRP